jgi:hypothetical protein
MTLMVRPVEPLLGPTLRGVTSLSGNKSLPDVNSSSTFPVYDNSPTNMRELSIPVKESPL